MPIRTRSGGSVSSGRPGAKPSMSPPSDEQDRIRDPQRVREQEQRRGRDEEGEELELLVCAETAHRGA